MTVGKRVFAGKGAREAAANALTSTILSWSDDQTTQLRGTFRGFEILSRGKSGGLGLVQPDERIPDLFIRGQATYSANLNGANPLGTVQSIEHSLGNPDKLAAEHHSRVARIEKELADYQSQADRPFEHEERLRQLLGRQAEINALLGLDKGDQQAAPVPDKDDPEIEQRGPTPPSSEALAKMAAAYMRGSDTAIREMPISERTPPQMGQVTGTAVAKDDTHIAVATATNGFVIVESSSLGCQVQIGERLSLRFLQGRALLDGSRDRG